MIVVVMGFAGLVPYVGQPWLRWVSLGSCGSALAHVGQLFQATQSPRTVLSSLRRDGWLRKGKSIPGNLIICLLSDKWLEIMVTDGCS